MGLTLGDKDLLDTVTSGSHRVKGGQYRHCHCQGGYYQYQS